MALSPNRLWIALFGVALIAFAGCAVGALDCTVFKPVGLVAALGAAVVSVFDSGESTGDEAPSEG